MDKNFITALIILPLLLLLAWLIIKDRGEK